MRYLQERYPSMSQIDQVRDSLIGKLLAVRDLGLLKALDKYLTSIEEGVKVELSEDQLELLQMSENDIKKERYLSQEELFDRERQWLKDK